ncbi:acyltransferase [Micromonospora sp. ATCC 39149]|uniref:Acyltransferase n=1 Tax=Micromonospora carbonacea TaxID=47853 RepID=A0A7D5Y4T6_9ACTN|nr:acyltransferase [Micromonospora sp. ATCC 39149]QLJ96678.1 acyltransferase [Micromonospora carbonacea]
MSTPADAPHSAPVQPAAPERPAPPPAVGEPSHASPPDRPRTRFRGDIEGIRAVAVVMVMLFHAGVPALSGGFAGVDVFFVISGYLITTQLLSEQNRTGSVALIDFYARRAKRLLPAANVLLLTAAVFVFLMVPRGRWGQIGGDIVAAVAYLLNWRLAERFTHPDPTMPPSPVQHFWSLAVEEQYYLIWPLLILLAVALAKVSGARLKPVLATALGLLAAGSLAWSVTTTVGAQSPAFFQTTSRIWELAVGAGVAMSVGAWARLPKPVAVVLGWAGLAAVLVTCLLFTPMMDFPGYTAALPVLGTAAVIAAGCAATRGGVGTLLGIAPLRWVGALSYSLYLWHWPMLAIAATYWGPLSMSTGLLVIALSIIPAWLTFHFVENRIRYSRRVSQSPRLALGIGAGFSALGALAGIALLLAS